MNTTSDPWVITQREKQKYQEQFKSLQPQNGFVTGVQAKGFFLQSQLPPMVLGHIWALADTDSDGKMNIHEFSIACKLINLKLRGMELPKVLPPSLLSSALAVGTTPTITPTSMSPLEPMRGIIVAAPGVLPAVVPPVAVPVTAVAAANVVPPPTGMVPASLPGVMPQVVAGGVPLPGMVPNAMGVVPVLSGSTGTGVAAVPMGVVPAVPAAKPITTPPTIDAVKVPATPTPPTSQPPSRTMSISERAPSIESLQGNGEWSIQAQTKRKYTQIFNATDRQRTGYLTGVQAIIYFKKNLFEN